MLTYGLESGTDLALQIVNGSGIGEGFMGGNFDDDKYKNFMGRVSQDVGEHIRIGAMGYYGKEQNELTEGINGTFTTYYPQNELWMLGGDATITFDPIELNLQYVERNDNNPTFLYNQDNPIPEIATRGAFAELIYLPKGDDSKWYAVGLFNWIESDFSELNYKTVSGHLGYVFKRNIRMVVEANYNFKQEYTKFGLGVITAF